MMGTLGRITATLILCTTGLLLQQLGCIFIRHPHEPFDLGEIAGLILIGAGWVLFSQVWPLWMRRAA